MTTASKRGELLRAAKKLMWEQGYEGMSPRDLLRESGAGQGSLYHHFAGKLDLASTALDEVSREMQAFSHALIEAEGPPLERVFRYLELGRDGLKGCRMGRFAGEASIVEPAIRSPVEAYFKDLQAVLASALQAAQHDGSLPKRLDAKDLALTLIAIVQGGFVLSRIHQDKDAISRATAIAKELLRFHVPNKNPTSAGN